MHDNHTSAFSSGYFFNIQTRFVVEGILGGLIQSVMDLVPSGPTTFDSGNSVGVFQDPISNQTEAIVLRLELPVLRVFGISAGTGSPVVHFQVSVLSSSFVLLLTI